MKSKLQLIFGFFFLLPYLSISQENKTFKFSHSLYAELYGATYVGYSLNYELIFRDKLKNEFAFRIGGGKMTYSEGLYPNSNNSAYALPIEILMIIGKINSGAFEIGIGGTPTYGNRVYNRYKGTKYPASATTFVRDFTPFSQLGFRYQSNLHHYILRLDLTYLILSRYYNSYWNYANGKSQFWFGFSFGYCLQ